MCGEWQMIENFCVRGLIHHSMPVLPTVYSEELSYLEDISKIAYKIQEIIDYYNALEDTWRAYTDNKVADLKNALQPQITANREAIENLNAKFTKAITDEHEWAENTIANTIARFDGELNAEVNKLKVLIGVTQANSYEYTNFRINELKNELANLTTVYVFNPVRGRITDVNTAINDLYSLWSELFGLSAFEYDALNLTASEYDGKYLSAIQYDIFGKLLLYKDDRFYMFNPITGRYELIKEVVYKLAELHYGENSYTCTEYDALDLTATVYDGKNVTAYNFDWNGKDYLVA